MARTWFILLLPNTLGWNSLNNCGMKNWEKKNTKPLAMFIYKQGESCYYLASQPLLLWSESSYLRCWACQDRPMEVLCWRAIPGHGSISRTSKWGHSNPPSLPSRKKGTKLDLFIGFHLASLYKYNVICFLQSCPRPRLQEPEVHSKIPLSL